MTDPASVGDGPVITWLDPGLTTGLAWWNGRAFGSWQYDKPDLTDRLNTLSELYDGRLAVGYERYIITSGGVRRGTPRHSMGVIERVDAMAEEGLFTLLPPMPSSARKLANPVMLRRLGWYLPGKVHANDASQHLLAYLLRTRPMPQQIRSKLFPGY